MSGPSTSTSRLMIELKDVVSQTIPVVFAQPEESDIHHWHALIGALSCRALPAKTADAQRVREAPVGAAGGLTLCPSLRRSRSPGDALRARPLPL